MAEKPSFYLTTPIFYPNGVPHIGHAYKAIASDAIARFERLDGKDVFFLTGTDEHGLKMQQTAIAEGLTPIELADRNSQRFRDMTAALDVSKDDFIRTTEKRHYRASQEIWRRMEAAGDIYLDKYAGWYSVRQEAYFDEKRDDARATTACAASRSARRSNGWRRRATSSASPPIRTGCLRITRRIRTSSARSERRNEVVSFVKGGLEDLSISRTHLRLGHPRSGRRAARDVRLGRRADQLHHRPPAFPTRRIRSGASGPPTCTSSARTSCASTPSTGRPS